VETRRPRERKRAHKKEMEESSGGNNNEEAETDDKQSGLEALEKFSRHHLLMQVAETNTNTFGPESYFPVDKQGTLQDSENWSQSGQEQSQYSKDIESPQNRSRGRRKRTTYATEEERRIARIMKNRRTAEESRLRRIQRIQELQNILIESQQREEKLNEEIVQLRQELAAQVAEVNRLRAALLRRQNK